MPPIHGLVEATKLLSSKELHELAKKYRHLENVANDVRQRPRPPQYFQLLSHYRALYRVVEQFPNKMQLEKKKYLRKCFSKKKKPISREQWNFEIQLARQLESKWRYEFMELKKEAMLEGRSNFDHVSKKDFQKKVGQSRFPRSTSRQSDTKIQRRRSPVKYSSNQKMNTSDSTEFEQV